MVKNIKSSINSIIVPFLVEDKDFFVVEGFDDVLDVVAKKTIRLDDYLLFYPFLGLRIFKQVWYYLILLFLDEDSDFFIVGGLVDVMNVEAEKKYNHIIIYHFPSIILNDTIGHICENKWIVVVPLLHVSIFKFA